MGVFSTGGIGLDLGSGYTAVYLENEGVQLREPTCVLVNRENMQEPLTIGREAKQMLGRTSEETVLVEPVVDGAVADAELAALMMLGMAEKATGRRKPFDKCKLTVTCTQGATRVEKLALENAVELTGAKKALVLKSPVAAALGAGVRFEKPRGVLVISIGNSVTEIAVLSMYGVVAARTMKTGSLAFDEAIVRYIRRTKGLVIGLRTAEELKRDIGTAIHPKGEKNTVLLRGRHVVSGKPSTESINEMDVHLALNEPIRAIIEAICDALYNVPPELTGDILEDGIHLTGGGALLDGLAKRLEEETKLSVLMSASPQDDAVIGAGMTSMDDKLARVLINADAAVEL